MLVPANHQQTARISTTMDNEVSFHYKMQKTIVQNAKILTKLLKQLQVSALVIKLPLYVQQQTNILNLLIQLIVIWEFAKSL